MKPLNLLKGQLPFLKDITDLEILLNWPEPKEAGKKEKEESFRRYLKKWKREYNQIVL